MAVQIGAKPDSGFDNPLGMLADCHRRIERFLDILCRIAEQAGGVRALSTEERNAIEAGLGYFRESGPRHNSDEEDSVFPRLRGRDATEVLAEMRRLEADHAEAGELHREMDRLYGRWIAELSLGDVDHLRLQTIAARLREIYREHIRVEEEVVFPCAAKAFGTQEIAKIGAEFKARRAPVVR